MKSPFRVRANGFVLLLVGVLLPRVGQGDCLDYEAYLRWLGSIHTADNALGVAVIGSEAYVTEGNAGFQVIDVSDSTAPKILGAIDTPGSARGVTVSGSMAYVGDSASGL